MKNEISVEFEIGFADSNIHSYSVDRDNLTLQLECWNAEFIEIIFIGFTSLFAMNYCRIADLKETFEPHLLEKTLKELYVEEPSSHNFRIFKFINSDNMTALEIVCEDIKIKKITRSK